METPISSKLWVFPDSMAIGISERLLFGCPKETVDPVVASTNYTMVVLHKVNTRINQEKHRQKLWWIIGGFQDVSSHPTNIIKF